MRRFVPLLFVIAGLAALPPLAKAQSAAGSGGSTSTAQQTQPGSAPAQQTQPMHAALASTYTRPTGKQKFHNYLFDSVGPYAMLTGVVGGLIQQADDTPPEWGQGWDSYGVRVANNFGINLVAVTARYGMAEAFREDTIFYRCECSGFVHRFEHALISTVTARRGDDGHRTFSFSNLAAPYAGTMTAALGWYPRRFEPMDGFRMGNYLLLSYAGQNLAKEFIYGGPHTLVKSIPLMHHDN
jgi:hypothetical protein